MRREPAIARGGGAKPSNAFTRAADVPGVLPLGEVLRVEPAQTPSLHRPLLDDVLDRLPNHPGSWTSRIRNRFKRMCFRSTFVARPSRISRFDDLPLAGAELFGRVTAENAVGLGAQTG
jgi:hypothetical protein